MAKGGQFICAYKTLLKIPAGESKLIIIVHVIFLINGEKNSGRFNIIKEMLLSQCYGIFCDVCGFI